jgi:hypothetical protein
MEDIAERSNLVSITSNLISTADKDLLMALEGFIVQYKRSKNIQNIPVILFSTKKLGVLEVIVKYLKENNSLSYVEIAKILNRDQRTIWTTYSKAIKKHKETFRINHDDEFISISSFSDMNYSPLQVLIKELEERGNSLTQIAKLTNRSYKNIWMTKKRNT